MSGDAAPEALPALREEMDAVNAALLPLLLERLRISGRIADVKLLSGLPVRDPAREEAMLSRLLSGCPAELSPYALRCFRALIDAGCDYQAARIREDSKT